MSTSAVSAPSYKHPYSPSTLRALVSGRYSDDKHHHHQSLGLCGTGILFEEPTPAGSRPRDLIGLCKQLSSPAEDAALSVESTLFVLSACARSSEVTVTSYSPPTSVSLRGVLLQTTVLSLQRPIVACHSASTEAEASSNSTHDR